MYQYQEFYNEEETVPSCLKCCESRRYWNIWTSARQAVTLATIISLLSVLTGIVRHYSPGVILHHG